MRELVGAYLDNFGGENETLRLIPDPFHSAEAGYGPRGEKYWERRAGLNLKEEIAPYFHVFSASH